MKTLICFFMVWSFIVSVIRTADAGLSEVVYTYSDSFLGDGLTVTAMEGHKISFYFYTLSTTSFSSTPKNAEMVLSTLLIKDLLKKLSHLPEASKKLKKANLKVSKTIWTAHSYGVLKVDIEYIPKRKDRIFLSLSVVMPPLLKDQREEICYITLHGGEIQKFINALKKAVSSKVDKINEDDLFSDFDRP